MKESHGVYPDPPPPYDQSTRPNTASAINPNAVIVASIVPVGPESSHVVCPHCNFVINTSTRPTPSMKAYFTSALLAIFGCWFCICVPCCFDECYDVSHYCPNCNAYLGKYQR